MNHITTLGEVYDRVQHMSRNCFDEDIRVKDVAFRDLETIQIGDHLHHMEPLAARHISTRLGVPYSYLQRCEPDLQAYNLNRSLMQERNDELFFRFDENSVRAIFTKRYIPLNNLTVLDQLTNMDFRPETAVQAHLDHRMMLLNIPDTSRDFTIAKDDRMLPGVAISNSEVGLSSLSISAFLLRLVCTNGMISSVKTNTSNYRHISEKPLQNFPELVNKATSNVDDQKKLLTFSLESHVDNPQSTMSSFNKQFLLNDDEKDAVAWAFPQEVGKTLFHIVQAYTKAPQYQGLPADSAYKLQKVGGSILAIVREVSHESK